MTDPSITTPPVCELPLSTAVEELTGYELLKLEQHFKKEFSDLGATKVAMGVVWAYECRRVERIIPWPDVEQMTLRQYGSYFAPEPEDPETADELGKEESVTGD